MAARHARLSHVHRRIGARSRGLGSRGGIRRDAPVVADPIGETMFRAIAVTQWKWTRTVALLATVAAFSLPLAALQSARQASTPLEFIAAMQAWGLGYALLAAGVGLAVALAAWGHDHQGRHVYALSLPVSRSH